MAEPLRDSFGPGVARRIAAMVGAVHRDFDQPGFVADCLRGFEPLELTERGRHFARALRHHLPQDVARALGILRRSLGPRLPGTELLGMAGFVYLPHVFFVGTWGISEFEAAMRFQHQLTQRFTAEWSIRPFLEQHPERTLARLAVWARDESPHVRRLVSEGTRPRLPWAPRLRAFQRDPRPVLALLELLKDDPELYVRRSVGNNLNDIGKDHPRRLISTCRRWLAAGASPERRWLVRHALRSVIKRGDPAALRLLGYGDAARPALERVAIVPRRLPIGGSVRVVFSLRNTRRARRALLVDLRVHYVKAGGGRGAKVFKLKEVELAGGGSAAFAKTLACRQLTTRKHFPGRHRLVVLVNGEALPLGVFTLTPAAPTRRVSTGRGRAR